MSSSAAAKKERERAEAYFKSLQELIHTFGLPEDQKALLEASIQIEKVREEIACNGGLLNDQLQVLLDALQIQVQEEDFREFKIKALASLE